MCIKKILTFALCGHSGATNPNLIFIVSDDCLTKDCENLVEQTEFHPDEKCFECIGVEAFIERYDGPPVFYKHCFQSEICDHEYEHMVTDIPRDPYAGEIVLVTPIHHEICPECKANGFDRKPGGTNPPPKTPSVMPRDFEGLPRADMASVRPSLNPGTSRLPSATYNPGASRVPAGSKHPTKVGRDSPQTLDVPRIPAGSKTTVAGGSRMPFNSTDNVQGLPTVIYTPPSIRQHSKAPTQKPMSAADYLKRGVPQNVAKSGFYDNADGEEAKANLRVTSKPSSSQASRSGTTTQPSHAQDLGIANRSASDSDSPFHSSTIAPPADAPSADLERELAGLTMAPKSVAPHTNYRRQTVESVKSGESPNPTVRPSSTSKPSTRPSEHPAPSRIAPPSRSPSGNSVYPAHVPPSIVPPAPTSRPNVAPASSTSKSSHHGSQPTAPSSRPSQSTHTSSTHRSSASHSTAPRHLTIPPNPPLATPKTALPQYQTMEPSRSAFPGKAPPA